MAEVFGEEKGSSNLEWIHSRMMKMYVAYHGERRATTANVSIAGGESAADADACRYPIDSGPSAISADRCSSTSSPHHA